MSRPKRYARPVRRAARPGPGRRGTATTLALALALSSVALKIHSATPPPPTPDSPPHDSLWLRQGDPWVGTLQNPTLEIRTPYARVELDTDQISQVHFADGPQQLDQIITLSSNQLSGFVLDDRLQFQPQVGSHLSLRRDQIARVTRHSTPLPPFSGAPSHYFFLRNGDRLTGRIVGTTLRLNTPQTTVTLAWTQIQSVSFTDAEPVLARLRTVDQRTLEGTWPDRDIALALDSGPTIQIYPTRIAAIESRPDLSPPETSGNHASLTPPSDPNAPQPPWPGLVWIPPGTFTMGSAAEEPDRDLDEGPRTEVTFTQGFFISAYEVTQADYQAVMDSNPSLFIGDSRRPVEKVRYRDALEYCRRLTQQHQTQGLLPAPQFYRLPTEAEWEYACRANTTARFSHGDDPQGYDLEAYAWFNGNSDSSTHPVGTRLPNPWGLYDMHGNVLEWCLDQATSTLPGGKVVNPSAPPPQGLLRIARGGSWLHGAKACRSANRDSYGESTRSSDLGFRIALSAPSP